MIKNSQAVQDLNDPGARYKLIFSKEMIATTHLFNNSVFSLVINGMFRGFVMKNVIEKVLIKV
jgi:hypothetical protein